MNRIKKIVVSILASMMLVTCAPLLECNAAGLEDYTSATEIEFNKLYIWKIPAYDEYTGERSCTWYKVIPKTPKETKVEMIKGLAGGLYDVDINILDGDFQGVEVRNNKMSLKQGSTYYIKIQTIPYVDVDVSLILKTSSEGMTDNSNNSSDPTQTGSNGSNDLPTDNSENKPSDSTNNNQGNRPGNNSGDNSSDVGDVDSDFWDDDVDDNNGSDVYDDELPVPEITEVENGNRSVAITWSCDDADSIDGYYIYRSKDGNNWNKIATIKDTEIEDYEDREVADGDICGYIVCSYSGENKSENSVPEYTCFLKKVTIKSVKSNASKKLNIKWSVNAKSSGYQVRFSTTKSFTKTTTSSVTINSRSESSKTISKLKGGKKYYVQIQTFRKYNGEVYYSGWSPTKSVKVKG